MIIDKKLLYCAYKEYLNLYKEHEYYESVLGGMLIWVFNYTACEMKVKELRDIISLFSFFRRHKLAANSFFEEFINKSEDLPFE